MVCNTVAALKTAFTQEQSRLLLRYTKDIILARSGCSWFPLRCLGSSGRARVSIRTPDAKILMNSCETMEEAFADALENRTIDFLSSG